MPEYFTSFEEKALLPELQIKFRPWEELLHRKDFYTLQSYPEVKGNMENVLL